MLRRQLTSDMSVLVIKCCWQGGLSNEGFEDNFVPEASGRLSGSDVRDVFRERDELRTQLECATDELRLYKPECVLYIISYIISKTW